MGIVRENLDNLHDDPKQPLSFSGEPVFTVENGWKRENLRAVVLVQESKSHRVLGASSVPLK